MKNLNDFILWLWEYFEEKCERISSKIKAMHMEKSIKRIHIHIYIYIHIYTLFHFN